MFISTGNSDIVASRCELGPKDNQPVVPTQPSAATTAHSENDEHASTVPSPPDFSLELLREDDYSDADSGDQGPLTQTQLLGGITKGLGLKDELFKRPAVPKDRVPLKQTKLCFDRISPETVEGATLKRKRAVAKDNKPMVQTSLVEDENAERDPTTWGESDLLPTTTINKTWAMACYHLSKSEIEELDFNPVPRKDGKMHLYNAREVEYRAWQKYGGPKGFARALDVMRDKHERNHHKGMFRYPKWRRFTIRRRGKPHVVEMLIYDLEKNINERKKGRTGLGRSGRKWARAHGIGRK